MTQQELLEAVQNISENRIKRLKLQSWAAVELGRIVNRKWYWWRRKALTIDTEAGTRDYDLATVNAGAAKDFLQMDGNLFRYLSDTDTPGLGYEGRASRIAILGINPQNGTPTSWTIKPGSPQVIRLNPVPVAVETIFGMYYAGVIPNWTSPDLQIALLPAPYHYVLLASMERRAFYYLYGQKDPRAVIAAQAEQQALADLDSYYSPTTGLKIDMRSGDTQDFVSATA